MVDINVLQGIVKQIESIRSIQANLETRCREISSIALNFRNGDIVSIAFPDSEKGGVSTFLRDLSEACEKYIKLQEKVIGNLTSRPLNDPNPVPDTIRDIKRHIDDNMGDIA